MPEVASLLADTHVWFRWRNQPSKRTKSQARVLLMAERRGQLVAVSAISLWELAQVVSRGRVRIDGPVDVWLQGMVDHPLD